MSRPEPVPRGTGRAPPPAHLEHVNADVFGDRTPLARRYVEHLAASGTERGLVGPREVPRLWERHVLNCAALAPLCPQDTAVIDVGTGAGLPGLVLALARPDLEVVLVEPLARRVAWLGEVVDDLGLAVRVVRARAQECGVRAGTVTARAVAPLDRLAGWCLPLVEPGGQLLALKGRSAAEELAAAEPALRRAGAGTWEVLEVLAGSGAPATRPGSLSPTTVVRVTVSPA